MCRLFQVSLLFFTRATSHAISFLFPIVFGKAQPKISLFPVARPGHFFPKSRTFFENVRMHVLAMLMRIVCMQVCVLEVAERGESNFKVTGYFGRQ